MRISRLETRDIFLCQMRPEIRPGRNLSLLRRQRMPRWTRERIRKQLSKTGDSMFTFTDLSVECEGNVFMPVQALNKMRRDVLEKLKEEILSGYRRNSSVPPTKERGDASCKGNRRKRSRNLLRLSRQRHSSRQFSGSSRCTGNYPRENTGSIWRRRALMPRSGKTCGPLP